MKKSDIESIYKLIEIKIKLLKSYEGITSRVITEDIEKVDTLLDTRQCILDDFNKASAQISSIVAQQALEAQGKLNAILRYKELDEVDEALMGLKEKLLALKAVINAINIKEKAVFARMKDYKQELTEEMLRLNKSKRIIDYFDTTTKSDLFHGKEFDEKL